MRGAGAGAHESGRAEVPRVAAAVAAHLAVGLAPFAGAARACAGIGPSGAQGEVLAAHVLEGASQAEVAFEGVVCGSVGQASIRPRLLGGVQRV